MAKSLEQKQGAYNKGIWAEHLAAAQLTLRGYRVLQTRYKTSVGEVDLIAVKNDTLAMIEVKFRKKMDDALAAISPRAQKRIEQTALHFIMENPEYNDHHIRFDVFAVSGPFSYKYLDNAWQPCS